MIAEAAMEYLAAQGHGAVGLTLRVGHQVDAPDNLCTLFDESAPAATESNIVALDQVGLQVLVRDVEYRAARDRCRAIHQRLVGFGGELPQDIPAWRRSPSSRPHRRSAETSATVRSGRRTTSA